MEEAGGVIAPEDFVDAANGVSGEHLPLAAVVAGRAAPGGGDFLAGATDVYEGLAITALEQLGVALSLDRSEGATNNAVSGSVHLEARLQLRGPGCVERIGAAGGLQGPVGIEVPDVEEAGGVVAPEDLVGAADGVSGQHLPFAAVVAGRAAPGGGDLLPSATDFHEGLAIAALEQLGVALGFEDCEGIADDAISSAIHLEARLQLRGSG